MLTAVALAVVASTFGIRADASPSDTRKTRDAVRAERAKAASQVDALRASQAEVLAALRALDENVSGQEVALAEAERAVRQAQDDAARARAQLVATQRSLDGLRRAMAAQAVDAYTHPSGDDLSSLLDARNASEAAQRQALTSLRNQQSADVTDRYRALKAQIEVQQREADDAARRAKASRAEVANRLGQLKQARGAKASFATQVEKRISTQLARSVELAKQDRALSGKLALEEAQLRARLLAQAQMENDARERARQAALARTRVTGSGGSVAPVVSSDPIPTAGIDLCTVGGITVSCSISGPLGDLLNAAAAQGLRLTGGGYRDPSNQIALRRANCGSSYYAIYEMSPSACRPPTARPGQSQHEVGLAVDFSNCESRGSACYRWLAGNASRFGFYNLPSEPWHWSINGQ